MKKQVNLLYFSATGTTAKVVKAIASSLSETVKEHNITLPDNRNDQIIFGENDLVIIGVPVYSGRVPAFLSDYFSMVKGHGTAAVFVVVYGNRDYDDALLELKNIFESNGFFGIAGGAFIGEHSNTVKVGTGRPDMSDLKTAQEFGLRIKEQMTSQGELLNGPKITVRGNFPYKERNQTPPMPPETNDQCTHCGVCADNCPMGAINFDDYSAVDELKCIHCSSCVKKCPVGAKAINHETHLKITQRLIDNCSIVRHEPELFI